MDQRQSFHDFSELFSNGNPETVWEKAAFLISRTSPAYDFAILRPVFEDIVSLFKGEYPGYCQIKTPYHNLSHTMDVFLCAARLIHGMKISGQNLSDREITLVMIATLMHDIGYAQLRDGGEKGTGAQYTPVHVERGLVFMRCYIGEHKIPADYADDLAPVITCSDPRLPITRIRFPNERVRLVGQILGSADLVGQMADRNYLEKLVFLFQEFEEARMGDYKSVHDMMRKTQGFYARIQRKLDEDFGGLYRNLKAHFKDALGEDRNFYMESITKNMDYLARITAMEESEYLSHLRRGGIIKKFQSGHSA
jgi:hypothetical protein